MVGTDGQGGQAGLGLSMGDQGPWTVLVVDDDDDVHAVTRLVLASFNFAGRGVRLLHARSAAEAEGILRAGDEIAVILLDVAMETPTAGLDLTRLVRDTLNIHDTRIVLRTGRQEQFPERDIILRYDINDYRSHIELDETRLLSTVVTALRAYDRLRTIVSQRDELRRLNTMLEERIVARTAEVREGESRLRSILETTVLPIFITSRADGMALFANASASRLLGLGPGRHDHPIWCRPEDRAALLKRLDEEQRVDDHEAEVRTPDGHRFWALIAAITMSLDGEPAYLLTFNDISARKAMEDELRRLATTDPLTGIFNRRHLMDQGERELRRARRYDTDLALLILDIDHFKRVNDCHGHAIGDDALKALVRVCLAHLREIDLMCRLGGEEFVAILPETSGEAAMIAAERLRLAVERLEVPLSGGELLRFTISIGVAAVRQDDATLADVLTRADEALYEAKGGGRNQVRQGL